MGVPPLVFEEGTSWQSLGLKGDETVTVHGLGETLKPRQTLHAEIVSADGAKSGRPFGFSWPLAVWPRKTSSMGVGLSWISLDSLVRIETYQLVTRDGRSKVCLVALVPGPREAPAWGARSRGRARGQSLSI